MLSLALILAEAALLAFPGAQGFGRHAVGGRGGEVYHVTQLGDRGEGSLRAALEAEGPRTVVFEVSGNISLESGIVVDDPFLTIAGQTAPGDGVCVRHHGVEFRTHDVIVRHMRFRPGDVSGGQPDAVSVSDSQDIIFDHCSMSWGVDEVMTLYGNERTTVQWSVISESLHRSSHEKGEHGRAGIWGGHQASYHYNLLAHHHSWVPRLAPHVEKMGLIDFRNNVVYNWGLVPLHGGEGGRIQVIHNYFKPGKATLSEARKTLLRIGDRSSRWHMQGNVVEGSDSASKWNWKAVKLNGPIETQRVDKPFCVFKGVEFEPAAKAYERVLAEAGATRPERDAVDRRIVDDVRKGRVSTKGGSWQGGGKGIIDSQKEVGGWPELKSTAPRADEDRDGMADAWERKQGLDPTDPGDRNAVGDGHRYTHLERYLNGLAARTED